MAKLHLLNSAALALVCALSLAACNKQNTSPAAEDEALPLTSGPATAIVAAPVSDALPAAPRPQIVARTSPQDDDYSYVDRAYAMSEAIGDAPPDYGFDYQDSHPWVWRSTNRSTRLVEPVSGGYRDYYYQPGANEPYLVRDPQYSYGFSNGELVAVYDRNGRLLPYQDLDGRDDDAGRILARAAALYNAALQSERRAVNAANWAAQQAALADERTQWQAEQNQQDAWRAYHAAHAAQDQEDWNVEHARREQSAQSFSDWRARGYSGPPPPVTASTRGNAQQQSDQARTQQRQVDQARVQQQQADQARQQQDAARQAQDKARQQQQQQDQARAQQQKLDQAQAQQQQADQARQSQDEARQQQQQQDQARAQQQKLDQARAQQQQVDQARPSQDKARQQQQQQDQARAQQQKLDQARAQQQQADQAHQQQDAARQAQDKARQQQQQQDQARQQQDAARQAQDKVRQQQQQQDQARAQQQQADQARARQQQADQARQKQDAARQAQDKARQQQQQEQARAQQRPAPAATPPAAATPAASAAPPSAAAPEDRQAQQEARRLARKKIADDAQASGGKPPQP